MPFIPRPESLGFSGIIDKMSDIINIVLISSA
jgi:hypothetical protein